MRVLQVVVVCALVCALAVDAANPLSAAEQKIVADRNRIKTTAKKANRIPLKADADNADIAMSAKISSATGAALAKIEKIADMLHREASVGFRNVDRLLTTKGGKAIIEYKVSKGQYTRTRPNSAGFADMANAKLTKLQKAMCAKPSSKAVCEKINAFKKSVVGQLLGKAVEKAGGLLDKARDKWNAWTGRSLLEADARYKIFGAGAHHERMICEALKTADLSKVAQTLVTVVRSDAFTPTTDCDTAMSKLLSSNLQWWPTIGARWNDVPCDGTDKATFDDDFVDTCYDLNMNPTMNRSHNGDRAYWHSMTNVEIRKAFNTQADIVNAIANQAAAWLNQATTLGPESSANWKPFLWNLGRTAHMIGDSYACGHVVRANDNAKLNVLFFEDYDTQDHDKHSENDKKPVVGTAAGTVRAMVVIKDIVKIFFHALDSKLTGKYVKATSVGGADGAAELAAYIKAEVYPFHSPEHAAYTSLGCNVNSVMPAGAKGNCPQKLSKSKADPSHVCPDNPKLLSSEFM